MTDQPRERSFWWFYLLIGAAFVMIALTDATGVAWPLAVACVVIILASSARVLCVWWNWTRVGRRPPARRADASVQALFAIVAFMLGFAREDVGGIDWGMTGPLWSILTVWFTVWAVRTGLSSDSGRSDPLR
jgi:hypothetical protein